MKDYTSKESALKPQNAGIGSVQQDFISDIFRYFANLFYFQYEQMETQLKNYNFLGDHYINGY